MEIVESIYIYIYTPGKEGYSMLRGGEGVGIRSASKLFETRFETDE